MTVRTITGNIVDITGATSANTPFTIIPESFVFGDGASQITFGDVKTVTSDGSGEVSFELFEGKYLGRISTTQGAKVFGLTVDGEGPWTLGRLVNQLGDITPSLAAQILQAVDDAIEAANTATTQAGIATEQATLAQGAAATAVAAAAAAGAPFYETPAGGVAATADGDLFFTVALGAAAIYKNDAGTPEAQAFLTIPTFSNRAAFTGETVPLGVDMWRVFHPSVIAVNARLLTFRRDASGTAIESANGVKGSPAETPTLWHFGATGAGNQAIDEAAWTAAVAWADELFIPEGTYILRRAKLRPADKCRHVYGVYGRSVFLHPAMDLGTGASSVIDFYGTDADNLLHGLLVENIVIDGNKDNIIGGNINNCEGTDIDFCRDAKVNNVIVRNCISEGIDWDDCIDCSATGIFGINCGGMAVHISSNCERVHTYDSGAVSCGLDSGRPAFDTWATSKNCSINNCWSFECYRGFNMRGENSAVRGFTAVNSLGWGAWVEGFGCIASDIVIDGASLGGVDSSNRGLQLNCDKAELSNIRVVGSAGSGVGASCRNTTINGLSVEDCAGNALTFFATGTDNTIMGFKARGVSSGVQDTGARNSVSGIDIDGITGTGVQAQGVDGTFGPGWVRNAGGDTADLDGTRNKCVMLQGDTLGGAGFRIQSTAVQPRLIECDATGWTSVQLTNASPTLSVSGGFKGRIAVVIGDVSVTDNSIHSGAYIYRTDNGSSGGPSGVTEGVLHHSRRIDTGGETQMLVERGALDRVFTRSRLTGSWTSWAENWNSKNTTVDGDGFIKVAS